MVISRKELKICAVLCLSVVHTNAHECPRMPMNAHEFFMNIILFVFILVVFFIMNNQRGDRFLAEFSNSIKNLSP